MKPKYNSVTIDFETLDNKPTAVPLSIGVVPFNKGEEVDFDTLKTRESSLYIKIDRASAEAFRDLTISQGTLDWWGDIGEVARHVLEPSAEDVDLVVALQRVAAHLKEWVIPINRHGASVYCRGYDFDGGLLKHLYAVIGFPSPIEHYNRFRCIRTAIDELGFSNTGYLEDQPKPEGFIAHHALDDAAGDTFTLCGLQRRYRSLMEF